jgi:hypothetical protein
MTVPVLYDDPLYDRPAPQENSDEWFAAAVYAAAVRRHERGADPESVPA